VVREVRWVRDWERVGEGRREVRVAFK